MSHTPDEATRREILRRMIHARAFEDQLQELAAQQGRLPGMQILSTGQEAASVASAMALREDDVIVSNHRSHAHLLGRGADPGPLLAEIMGKADGVNRGKAGTLHLIVPEVNALMTSTVVGAGPPLAAGAAFAQQYRETGTITAVYFGDGAAAEGSVHEAMNLAGVWKLPLLFICENNCWAGAQSLAAHCSGGQIASRGPGYGMPGEMADGNDADLVYEATSRMAAHCRNGSGPALLELLTYRMRGHGEHDQQHYVDPEELEEWRTRDPILTYGRRLVDDGVVSEEDVRLIGEEAKKKATDALAFADQSPLAPVEETTAFVWVENPWTATGQGGGA